MCVVYGEGGGADVAVEAMTSAPAVGTNRFLARDAHFLSTEVSVLVGYNTSKGGDDVDGRTNMLTVSTRRKARREGGREEVQEGRKVGRGIAQTRRSSPLHLIAISVKGSALCGP